MGPVIVLIVQSGKLRPQPCPRAPNSSIRGSKPGRTIHLGQMVHTSYRDTWIVLGLGLENQSLGTGRPLRPWGGEGPPSGGGTSHSTACWEEKGALQNPGVWFPKTLEPLPTPTLHFTAQLAKGQSSGSRSALSPQTPRQSPVLLTSALTGQGSGENRPSTKGTGGRAENSLWATVIPSRSKPRPAS